MIGYFVEYIDVLCDIDVDGRRVHWCDIDVDGRNILIYFVPFIHVSENCTNTQAWYITGVCPA